MFSRSSVSPTLHSSFVAPLWLAKGMTHSQPPSKTWCSVPLCQRTGFLDVFGAEGLAFLGGERDAASVLHPPQYGNAGHTWEYSVEVPVRPPISGCPTGDVHAGH
jgi:hypothetical protein